MEEVTEMFKIIVDLTVVDPDSSFSPTTEGRSRNNGPKSQRNAAVLVCLRTFFWSNVTVTWINLQQEVINAEGVDVSKT